MLDRRHLTGRWAALISLVIVAATLLLAGALSIGCRTSPSVDPAVRKPIDDYFGGFQALDATRAVHATSLELRTTLPSTPEEMVAKMRGNAEQYGPIETWSIDTATVDTDNGQALATVRVTSKKVIYVMSVDLRRYEDGWRIYGLSQKDALRNPASTDQLPRDIGQANPFGSGVK
jgi:hypothetical protein